MPHQSDPSTLVDGVLAAAAHLEPELEEALAEHHLSRPSFQVLSALLDAVRERAARGDAEFTLLVPNAAHGLHVVVDAEDQDSSEAEQILELAIPLLEEATGGHVEGMVGDPSPMNAIQDAINIHGFDEVIISTLPTTVSKWLKLDLPSKVSGLGLPVTTVTAKPREGVAARP